MLNVGISFFHFFILSFFLCTFAPANERIATRHGALAQLVEHRTENPCVPGSIPGGTTPPFISPVFPRGAGFSFCLQINPLFFVYFQKMPYLCNLLYI